MEVSQFFPIGNNGTIVITTRNPDCQKHATAGTYHVDQMSSDDSVSLLLKIACETTQSERLKKDAEAIVGVLGYLALAIIQAGAVSTTVAESFIIVKLKGDNNVQLTRWFLGPATTTLQFPRVLCTLCSTEEGAVGIRATTTRQ